MEYVRRTKRLFRAAKLLVTSASQVRQGLYAIDPGDMIFLRSALEHVAEVVEQERNQE
jgi:hypothetical protein